MVAFAAATLIAVSTGYSIYEKKKQEKAVEDKARRATASRRKEMQAQKRKADIVATRARLKASAEAKKLKAQGTSLAVNKGVGVGGTTVRSIRGNLQQQLSSGNLFGQQSREADDK